MGEPVTFVLLSNRHTFGSSFHRDLSEPTTIGRTAR
jgi:hypothetical protein